MNDTYVTVVGNAVDAPTARRTENGTSVCNFRVASTSRRFDRETKAWVDGDSLFLKVTCWRQLADHVTQSVRKGDPVIVHGRQYTRQYEVEGQRRSSYEMEAVSVGHDLMRGLTEFQRPARIAPTYEVTGHVPGEDPEDPDGDLDTDVDTEEEDREYAVAASVA
jgi:single-strand DNA-binding protein